MTAAHKASLCSLAHRVQGLEDEIGELDERIEKLLVRTAPELLSRFGVGPNTAAALLVTGVTTPSGCTQKRPGPICAGPRPSRRHQARATGTASIVVVTARPTVRCGALSWSASPHDPETTAYFERKVKEGRSKRDVIRLLKRYVARELYRYLPRG